MSIQIIDVPSSELVPACGGTEHPFTVDGRRWLYCYHPVSKRHCYLDLDNDRSVWHREFHPAFHPEFEFVVPEPRSDSAVDRQKSDTPDDCYF